MKALASINTSPLRGEVGKRSAPGGGGNLTAIFPPGRVEKLHDSRLTGAMKSFKETRTYRWPVAAWKAIDDNPIDYGIALVFVGILTGWVVKHAVYAPDSLDDLANSWGDFGGSIIGGLVAFLLARLAMQSERHAQRQRYIMESGPQAISVLEIVDKWMGEVDPEIQEVKISLGLLPVDNVRHHDHERAARALYLLGTLPKLGSDRVGRLNSVWPLDQAEQGINYRLQRLKIRSKEILDRRGAGGPSKENDNDVLRLALYDAEVCVEIAEAMFAATRLIADGKSPDRVILPPLQEKIRP